MALRFVVARMMRRKVESVKWKITLGIIGSVLVVTPTAVALAQPQAAACALINYRGLDEVATGILASSDVAIGQRLDFVRLHTAAKLRIANTFGATRASPVIVIGRYLRRYDISFLVRVRMRAQSTYLTVRV